ncbi:pyruvate kinase [Neobacillus sp. LXY-1]|uniref:pyruvate kinase n=1 Tax=Neobacillus sp. LXY-1 TaxID=3379133 RepID=UPI003EDF86C3
MSLRNEQEFKQQICHIYQKVMKECKEAEGKFFIADKVFSRNNLLAYLALLQNTNSILSQQLVDNGFAPLDYSKENVLYTFQKIINYLNIVTDPLEDQKIITPSESRHISRKHSEDLFGPKNSHLQSSIMVTLDSHTLYQPGLLDELLMNGMNIVRINCAHNHETVWKQLINSLRNAEKRLKENGKYERDRSCKIYMDLAGPKIRIGDLGNEEIFVKKGDRLRLYPGSQKPGYAATEQEPAGVPVTLEKAFRNVRKNDRVFIDDGKISGFVSQITEDFVESEIHSPIVHPLRIKTGKGLNLPDSLLSLNVPALTEKDLHDLEFISKNADIIGISFVHSPLDLKKLRNELERLDAQNLAVVAKIETKDAVHQLSRIILEGLNFHRFGIMIARGDLAVEVGLENLLFVQEEIINICKASHIPVIWATGVLEKLTKKGIPARAEITDAGQAARANCIMLNKGPYVLDSLKMLTKLLNVEHVELPRQRPSISFLTAQYGIFDGQNKRDQLP